MDIMQMGKNPDFMGSWDLEELPNRETVLTVNLIADREVSANGRTEICTVCTWSEPGWKPMILNVTNKKTLCKLYRTKDTEKLRGKRVTVGVERVKAFGGMFDALRIRPRIPPEKGAKPCICSDCGQQIDAFGGMDAAQIAAYTAQKFGAALCSNCAKKKAGEPK